MKLTAIGWLIWIVAQGVLNGIDYYLRSRNGNLISGELSIELHLAALSAIGLASLYYFYKGASKLNIYARASVVVIQGALAVALMLWLSLIYICTAGIDCL